MRKTTITKADTNDDNNNCAGTVTKTNKQTISTTYQI